MINICLLCYAHAWEALDHPFYIVDDYHWLDIRCNQCGGPTIVRKVF